jgi:hypothetical protein
VSGQLHAAAALPQGKSPWYPLDRRLGCPQSRSGCGGEERNSQPLQGLEPPIIQLVAQRYTIELSLLLSKTRALNNHTHAFYNCIQIHTHSPETINVFKNTLSSKKKNPSYFALKFKCMTANTVPNARS